MKKCVISNLGTIVTGKTPSTKNENYWGNEIPFVTPKDIQSSKHIFNTERYLTTNGANSVKGCILPPKSICVSCIGNIGYTSMTIDRAVSNQQINSIIVNNEHDIDFVYYLMKSLWSYFKNYEGQSTTVSILNKSQFSKIEILIPDNINIERKIAAILSSLDNKIELNQRVNNNLEQQAQALFKSWFVDFEPFGGKMPDDWKVGIADDIITLFDSQRIPLSSNQRENMEKIYPYYGATSLMDYVDQYIFDGKYLLLGEDGSVVDDYGFPILQYVWGKFWVNNHAHILQGKNGFTVESLYLFFKCTNVKSIVTGAVQPKINQANLKSIPAIVPTINVMNNFNNVINPLFSLFRKNIEENTRLAQLRDTLLPKLMSGEIDVSKVNISADKLSFTEE